MQNIEMFKSVIGYFRASGYFAIRQHFPPDLKVKIIAGINVDPFIALAQKQGLLFNVNPKDTKQEFITSIQNDIIGAKYSIIDNTNQYQEKYSNAKNPCWRFVLIVAYNSYLANSLHFYFKKIEPNISW